MSHELLRCIPHQRVVTQRANREETFDLYQCGLFQADTQEENIEFVELQPESEYSLHYHQKSVAIVYVIAGTGFFHLENNNIEYQPGLRLVIPQGVLHGFKTITRTLFLSIQTPPIINPDNGEIDLYYIDDEV